jgi:transcriptional regulator with XRE-family HTH domain
MTMLSETLQTGLQRYAIGAKVRALRLRKKMGLVELGRHTGLSAALLSKIERGRLFPTLPTLLRVALVFNVGLDHFFTDEPNNAHSLIRRSERLSFDETFEGDTPIYSFECLDFRSKNPKTAVYHARFLAKESEPLVTHQHDGFEFIYQMTGTLKLSLGENASTLRRGDSVQFDSSIKHGYQSVGSTPCTAIVMITP